MRAFLASFSGPQPTSLSLPHTAPPPLELAGARLTIDLGALVANWRALAAMTPSAEASAVVKADAYGLGLEPVVAALAEAGCGTFFVALPQEGIRARAVAPRARIFVLNGLFDEAAATLAAHNLVPVLGNADEVDAWTATARTRGRRLACAIHVDTGMNRLGLTLDEARTRAGDWLARPQLDIALVMSHLACADQPERRANADQVEAFDAATLLFPDAPASLLNSAGIRAGRFPAYDLTRPGIALYGGEAIEGQAPLKPVARLDARVIQVRAVARGEAVGYGGAQTVRRDSQVAIVSLGYADGLHRLCGATDNHPGASLRHGGQAYPLIGRVSMDLTAVDITDAPEGSISRGSWLGVLDDTQTVDALARHAGTIGYEVLTGLGRRYGRRYVG